MPEVRFQIRWPDGSQETCYSPSLVIKEHLEPAAEYELADFLARARTALQEGSRRVEAKFGSPCGLALGQLQQLETNGASYRNQPNAKVTLLKFIE
jgi:uncharacterized repeat protein (TIGR04042 family)